MDGGTNGIHIYCMVHINNEVIKATRNNKIVYNRHSFYEAGLTWDNSKDRFLQI